MFSFNKSLVVHCVKNHYSVVPIIKTHLKTTATKQPIANNCHKTSHCVFSSCALFNDTSNILLVASCLHWHIFLYI